MPCCLWWCYGDVMILYRLFFVCQLNLKHTHADNRTPVKTLSTEHHVSGEEEDWVYVCTHLIRNRTFLRRRSSHEWIVTMNHLSNN